MLMESVIDGDLHIQCLDKKRKIWGFEALNCFLRFILIVKVLSHKMDADNLQVDQNV